MTDYAEACGGTKDQSPGVLDLLLAQLVLSLLHSSSQSLGFLPHLLLHYQGHSPTSFISRLKKKKRVRTWKEAEFFNFK